MGMLTRLLTMPVRAPVSGSLWIGQQIAKAAEAQYNDKSALRAALIEAEERLLAGELSEDDYDEIETDLLIRMKVAT